MIANNKLKHAISWVGGKHETEQIKFAQFKELVTKVPLLYFILLVNSLVLAYTFYSVAPNYLTVFVAAALSVGCVFRSFKWYGYRKKHFTIKQVEYQIKMTVLFSIIMGWGFMAWGIALFQYGDIGQQVHVAYYISITVFGIIVCLIHLPAAVWSISISVGIPFVIFFCATGSPIFMSIAFNFSIVAAVLVSIALSYYKSFSNVITSRYALEQQHKQTQALNLQNELLANQDGLTQLANRRSFAKHLENKLESASSNNQFIVGLCDLDGFKPVNDIHGHAAGDRVLKEVSLRLRQIVKDDCMLARIGGDEFGFVIDHSASPDNIIVLGNQITQALRSPFIMRSGLVQISGSCGFAVYPEAGNTVDKLLERADFALYQAKNEARGSSVVFSTDHEQLISNKSKIELALTQSMLNKELSLHYQPIVNGKTGDIRGFEALARWYNDELGHIPPNEFISIAEKTGIISELTLYLFELAVKELARWPEHLFLSFNLSVHDVMSSKTLHDLENILMTHNIAPQRVQFEITETIMMSDIDHCCEVTKTLREKGFIIALDDFGSGYSSLGYLHKLNFDTLKIDRSFVANLEHDPRSQGIIKTMLELCSNFDITSTIEGVETEAQRTMLLSLGCKNMQGYFFHRPAPISEFNLQIQRAS
ncbi:putative bifunctional diguanylate cyclase/phosphodiesterase [Glaciecola sp. 2405UD65-10]|uniref:putative bifunctional diguanylate cyclase/phosphodiesterase n=1 Tax=Glaciecola sp. 2405UD65-10 TaxID=3397244 RepID=UPI003B5C43EE